MKIEIEVTQENKEKVKAAIDLLFGEDLVATTKKIAQMEVVVEKPKAKSKKAPKIQEVEPEEEPEEEAEEETEDESSITIDMLRDKVSELAKNPDLRGTIKDKLTELGATSVTKLDSSDYEEFMDLLNQL